MERFGRGLALLRFGRGLALAVWPRAVADPSSPFSGLAAGCGRKAPQRRRFSSLTRGRTEGVARTVT